MSNTTTAYPSSDGGAVYTHAVHYTYEGMANPFPHWFYNLADAIHNAGELISSRARPRGMRIWVEGVDGEVLTEANILSLLEQGR
jgi:hypothetical protein